MEKTLKALKPRKVMPIWLQIVVALAMVGALPLLVTIWWLWSDASGRQAWEDCRRELEAKGEKLDWTNFIPAEIPDASNIFKAPKMTAWFVGRGPTELSSLLDPGRLGAFLSTNHATAIAEFTVVPWDSKPAANDADLVLRYDPPRLMLDNSPKDSAGSPESFGLKSNAIMPLISIEDVALTTVIKNLAKQAGLNYVIAADAGPLARGPNGRIMCEPVVTRRWENFTALGALEDALRDFDLKLVPNPDTGVALITKCGLDEPLPAQHYRAPVAPLITIDDVPLTTAIYNLARESGVGYSLDPKLGLPLRESDKKTSREAHVTYKWHDVTIGKALRDLLYAHGLKLVPNKSTGTGLITKRNPDEPVVTVDASAREDLLELAQKAVAQMTNHVGGQTLKGAQNILFCAEPLGAVRPARIIVRTDEIPSPYEIKDFLNRQRLDLLAHGPTNLEVETVGSNVFRVSLRPPPVCDAADYLAWSDHFTNQFNLIREALKRPAARMDGDYWNMGKIPLPNYKTLLILSQTLSQRAQCFLLLDQPVAALRVLTLLHGLSRLTGAQANGAGTLVAALSNAKITEMFSDAISDGLRLRAWREPQLAKLEEQLREVDLPPQLAGALREERTGCCRLFTLYKPSRTRDFTSVLAPGGWRNSKQFDDFILGCVVTSNWVYRNMIAEARLLQEEINSIDPSNSLISPALAKIASSHCKEMDAHNYPTTFLVNLVTPDYSRAIQTVAFDQTKVNEALIACALERYRLASGQYPDTLAELAPKFLAQIPHDLIGGGSLRYHSTESERFLLYSIGWNEKDDGGKTRPSPNGNPPDAFDPDWVWPQFLPK